MKLSILVVNWNTRDLVVRCIHSILKEAGKIDYEVVVVDNNSHDGSFETLQNLFGYSGIPRTHKEKVLNPTRSIRILPATRNLGFAKANNYAYQHATGEYALLLNPDTEVQPGALEKLVAYMEANPSVGVVGPKLINPDGTLQKSVRRLPGVWSSMIVFSGLHRFFRPRRYLMDDFDYDKEGDVDQVMGAALMTRRRIIERIGLFDEKFWLWYEEVDFCKRVKEAGYSVRYFPEARVMHHSGQSFVQVSVYKRKRTVARSLIYYFEKNGNWLDVIVVRAALPVVLFAAWFLGRLERAFGFKHRVHT